MDLFGYGGWKNRLMLDKILFVIPLMGILGCVKESPQKDYIISERDLIPEGLAFDQRTNTIYVSSTYKRKIVQINEAGEVSDFIEPEAFGIWSVVGMEVDESTGKLWTAIDHANEVLPLMNPDTAQDWMSGLAVFDLESGDLFKRYVLPEEVAFLNDLTILPNGEVFITESVNNRIYRTSGQSDSLTLFSEPEGHSFLNGITYSSDHQLLYVATTEGIIQVEPNSGEYKDLIQSDSIHDEGIDGLTYYENSLIGHYEEEISQYFLNEDGSTILRSITLNSGPAFDASTTGEVGADAYYFIVNSQIQSGIDRVNGGIKPVDSLKEVIIRELNLD